MQVKFTKQKDKIQGIRSCSDDGISSNQQLPVNNVEISDNFSCIHFELDQIVINSFLLMFIIFMN